MERFFFQALTDDEKFVSANAVNFFPALNTRQDLIALADQVVAIPVPHLVIHPLEIIDVAVNDPRRLCQRAFLLIFVQSIPVERPGKLIVIAQFSQVLHHITAFHQGNDEVGEDLAAFRHISDLREVRCIQAQASLPLLSPEQRYQKGRIPLFRRQKRKQLRPFPAEHHLI